MAKVTVSPLLSELSGKIGGVVVVNNSFGGSWRPRITPLYRNRIFTGTSKELLGYVSSYWAIQSEEIRSAFNRATTLFPIFSRLGGKSYPSGFALWMRVNVTRAQANLPLANYAPYQVGWPRFEISFFDFSPTSLKMNFEVFDSDATYLLFVYLSKAVSPGKRFPAKSSQRIIGVYEVAYSGSIDIFDDWQAAIRLSPYGPSFKISGSASLFLDGSTVRSAPAAATSFSS